MNTHRFLKEYANFKKRKLADDLSWAWTEAQQRNAMQGIERIDKILKFATSGLITLDEAMGEIAKV